MSSWRNCLSFNCLGDRCMGTDVDELLAYETRKVVRIKDRSLGVLKYIFMLVIFCYVFIWQLLYKGSHFQLDHVSGVARLQLQHPTKQCNPMDVACSSNYSSLQQLSYCKQYTGSNASAVQRECKYFDALELLTPMDSGYLVPTFVQTYDQSPSCTPSAENNYKCEKKYEFVDENGNPQTGPGRATPKGQFFVADVEDFTILIDHSIRTETGSVEYDDYKMQGYWLDCSNVAENKDKMKPFDINATKVLQPMSWLEVGSECEKKPILCLHKDCDRMGMMVPSKKATEKSGLVENPQSSAGAGPQPRVGYAWSKGHAGPRGDITDLKGNRNVLRQSRSGSTYVSLYGSSRLHTDTSEAVEEVADAEAPNSFEEPDDPHDVYALEAGDVLSMRTLYMMAGRKLDDWWYEKGEKKTSRQRGTVLVVNIHYNNLQPWTLFRPQDPPEYVISVTSRPVDKYKYMKAMKDTGDSRELTVEYGTLVVVQSSGTIGVFRMIHMLIVVSTSLGLLAAANVMTDLLAVYVLPMREEYSKAIYKDTADFHDMAAKRDADAARASSS